MIFKLFKIFASNSFSFNTIFEGFKKGPKGIIKSILLILVLVYVLAVFTLMYTLSMNSVYKVLAMHGNSSFMPVLSCFLALFIILFLGFTSVAANYYTGKCEDEFMAMPLTPVQLFGAKFGVSFVTDAVFAVLFFAIASFIYGFNEGLLTNPLFYLGFLAVSLSFSIFGVAIIYFLFILVLSLIPALRKRKILNLIASFFIIIFAAIYGLINSRVSLLAFGEEENVSALVPFINYLQNFSEKFPFISFISKAVDGNFIAILVLLVFTAVIIFALIPVMSKFYVKTLKGFSEGKEKKLSSEKVEKVLSKDIHSDSIFKALYWRDVKTVLREPAFFANGPLMIFLMPLIFLVTFSFGFISGSEGTFEQFCFTIKSFIYEFSTKKGDIFFYYASVIVGAVITFIGNMSMLASSSFSREGKFLYDLKAMPIQYDLIVKAKFWHAITYIIIADIYISLLLTGLGLFLGLTLPAAAYVRIFIGASFVSLSVSVLIVLIEMFIDTVNPKLQWENPTAAFKQNMNSLISVFFSMIVTVIAVILGLFVLPKNTAGLIIFTSIFTVIAAPTGAFYFKYSVRKIAKM